MSAISSIRSGLAACVAAGAAMMVFAWIVTGEAPSPSLGFLFSAEVEATANHATFWAGGVFWVFAAIAALCAALDDFKSSR